MPGLTQQELHMLEQQLQYEQAMVRKYKFCYQFCNDRDRARFVDDRYDHRFCQRKK